MNQTSQGVPIHVAHTLSGFQFLELPPELLAVVEKGDAKTLHLKSEGASTGAGQSRPDGLAVVCSADRTFEVRQAQSSNSIYVLQAMPRPGVASRMTAVALCKAALELVPVQPKTLQFLGQAIPTFRGLDAVAPAGEAVSKLQIQADAPFSAAEFESAWRELCAFEHHGSAWQPSNAVKLGAWSSFLSAAAVNRIKVADVFNPNSVKDLVEEDGYSAELLMAILRHLSEEGSTNESVRIDRSRCVSWLGMSALAEAGAGGVSESKLRERWQELLPDLWEDDARLENITGQYKLVDSTLYPAEATIADQAAIAKSSEKAPAKNKWHSKFAA